MVNMINPVNHRWVRLVGVIVALMAVLIYADGMALANPGSLSGTVTDSSNNKIPGVLIEVRDGANTVVGSDTTDVNGDYSFPSLQDDTYSLNATPPPESGFAEATIFNVVVSGITIRDIVLVPAVSANFSGKLLFSDNTPVPNIFLRMSNGVISVGDRTDADGNFSIDTTPDVYTLSISEQIIGPPPDNARIFWSGSDGTVDLTSGDVLEDLTLEDLAVTVNVTKESDGTIVPNATVQISNHNSQFTSGGRTWSFFNFSGFGQTGADASTVFRLAPTRQNSTFNITVTPPAGSGLAPKVLEAQPVSADTVFNIALPEPVTFSGRLLFSDGAPVPNVRILLSNGTIFPQDDTDADGNFSIETAADVYTIIVSDQILGPAPDNARIFWSGSNGTVDLNSGSVQEDLILEDFDVTVNVTRESDGTIVPNSTVRISNYSSQFTTGGRNWNYFLFSGFGQTGADASTVFKLAPTGQNQTFDITVTPPAGSGLAPAVLLNQTLTADATFDIALPEPATYSGKLLYGSDGTPVPNTRLFLSGNNIFAQDESDADGSYSIDTAPGSYTVGVSDFIFGQPPDNPRVFWSGSGGTVDLAGGDVQEDLILTDIALNVTVQDLNGGAVPNSTVSVSNYSSQFTSGGRNWNFFLFSIFSGTGSDGQATIRLAPTLTNGTVNITISPPSDSGFLPFTITNQSLSQDITITAVLQLVGSNDSDNDTIPNDIDNCIGIPNTDQLDTDEDGFGDACDPDDDNDGFSDDDEAVAGSDPLNPNSTPEVCDGVDNDLDGSIDEGFGDSDGDGVPDCTDDDDDNDGIPDEQDNCSLVSNVNQENADGVAEGVACDTDDDNDGLDDGDDNCPLVPNPDQEDSDGDGIGDACQSSIVKMTGGGSVPTGEKNHRHSFGFNIRPTEGMTIVRLEYNDNHFGKASSKKGKPTPLQIQIEGATPVTEIAIQDADGNVIGAEITAPCTVRNLEPDNLRLTELCRVLVIDNGEPGKDADVFQLDVLTGAGYTSNIAGNIIERGNIQAHKPE